MAAPNAAEVFGDSWKPLAEPFEDQRGKKLLVQVDIQHLVSLLGIDSLIEGSSRRDALSTEEG